MKSTTWGLLFLALGATFVNAQDDAEETYSAEGDAQEEEDEEYDDEADAHEVTTNYLLPEYADKRFPVGEEATILVDVSNNGQDVFNITRIGAFLHSPFDLSYYIQNFTVGELSGVAAPSAQISLEYKFTPDQKLEALEYWFSGFVEYTMEGSDEPYQQIFVNTTVHLYDDKNSIIRDLSGAASSALLLLVLGSGAYFGFNYAASKSGLKKKFKKKKEAKPAAAPAVDDWDVSTYQEATKSRVAGRKKRVSKK